MKECFYDVSVNHNIFILASNIGYLSNVKLLIENGADVNKESSDGSTALINGNNIDYLNERKFL